MNAANDNPLGGRGRAIVDLLKWFKSDGTAGAECCVKAVEAMEMLQLSDDDIETLLRSEVLDLVRIPFLVRVT